MYGSLFELLHVYIHERDHRPAVNPLSGNQKSEEPSKIMFKTTLRADVHFASYKRNDNVRFEMYIALLYQEMHQIGDIFSHFPLIVKIILNI